MSAKLLTGGPVLLLAMLCCPASSAAQQVSVSFYNPGYATQLIYRYDPNTNQELYWGGFAGGVTTAAIPSRPNDIWRFRLASNGRHVEDYYVTNQPQQSHEVQGFLTNAEEPDQSFIERVAGDLARAITTAWDQVAPVLTTSAILAFGDVGSLQARMNYELQAHQKEITDMVRWYLDTGQYMDPSTVRHLVENRDWQGLAALMRLDALRASQEARGPETYSAIPASYPPADQATATTGLISLGVTADGSFLAGGSAEAGMVWETDVPNPLPVGFYTSTAHGFGLSMGVDVSFSLGFWDVSLDQFLGRSIGVGAAVDGLAGLGVAVWFSCGHGGRPLMAAALLPGLTNSDCPVTESSRYLGATIQPGIGLAVELYEVNIAETTAQH